MTPMFEAGGTFSKASFLVSSRLLFAGAHPGKFTKIPLNINGLEDIFPIEK